MGTTLENFYIPGLLWAFHHTFRVETELLSTHSVPFYQSSFAKCPPHNRPGFRRERFMRPIKRNANVGGDFEKWQKYRHYRPARLQWVTLYKAIWLQWHFSDVPIDLSYSKTCLVDTVTQYRDFWLQWHFSPCPKGVTVSGQVCKNKMENQYNGPRPQTLIWYLARVATCETQLANL